MAQGGIKQSEDGTQEGETQEGGLKEEGQAWPPHAPHGVRIDALAWLGRATLDVIGLAGGCFVAFTWFYVYVVLRSGYYVVLVFPVPR